ncbi:MAG: PorV/PorQ family protein [Candidatus Eisenbacteria bacterium]|nr:PorV/PorQ family protein [Candidatus Eisenbacteria bacterium]
MTRVFVVAFCVALLLASISACALADKYAAEFLKVGAGARALGMGGAFVALADDASAIYWNPAGIASVRKTEIEAMHAEQFGSLINYDFVAVAFPISGDAARKASIGAAIIRLAVDDIPYTKNLEWEDYGIDQTPGTGDYGEGNGTWDPGERIVLDEGKMIWKSNADMALLLSYASELTEKISVGGTFKLVRQEIIDNSSLGAGVDIGAIYTLNKSTSFGLVVSDATTTQLVWDTGHHEFVAPTVRMGGQYTRKIGPLDGIGTAALDMEIGFEKRRLASQFWAGPFTADVSAGVEYWLKRAVAIRVGLDAGRFTAGTGARFSRFGFDYAFLSHKDLDNSHRVSASFRF